MIAGVFLGIMLAIAIGAPIAVYAMRRSNARMQRAVRRQHEAERLAQLGAMTGGLAHEIRNPLSTIGLNAQLIAEGLQELPVDDADRGRLTRRLEALRREVDRLRDILEDFLRLAGALHVEATEVDLNVVAEELADFFTPQAVSAGVRLRVEPAPAPVVALADVKHLKQAALNLMLNAAQVMSATAPADGARRELILRTERRTEAGEPVAVLHVIDTGPGVAADRLKEIFNPYVSMRAGGAGLGLAITKRIMDEHRGRIDAHSEPGVGSDFSLVIPAPAR